MTERVAFLAKLPVRAVLDGEIVAFDADGRPDFPLVCEAVPASASTATSASYRRWFASGRPDREDRERDRPARERCAGPLRPYG